MLCCCVVLCGRVVVCVVCVRVVCVRGVRVVCEWCVGCFGESVPNFLKIAETEQFYQEKRMIGGIGNM